MFLLLSSLCFGQAQKHHLQVITAKNRTAATYYVHSGGNDSNPGTSASPFLTIAYAYGKVRAGDSIIVKDGTYHEDAGAGTSGALGGYLFTKSGTEAKPITIKSQNQYVTSQSHKDQEKSVQILTGLLTNPFL